MTNLVLTDHCKSRLMEVGLMINGRLILQLDWVNCKMSNCMPFYQFLLHCVQLIK